MYLLKVFKDSVIYLLKPRKKIVLIISTMRSGSSLLKALLAQAPDVSYLPEVRFLNKQRNKFEFYNRYVGLSPEPIVVLKHPLWYQNSFEHWYIPQLNSVKTIVLVRDCLAVVQSCRARLKDQPNLNLNDTDLINYWTKTYEQIIEKKEKSSTPLIIVRYEDMLREPKAETEKLFKFIGSKQQEGVDSYTPPKTYEWEWGKDDGGQKLKTLKVVNKPSDPEDQVLLKAIESSPQTQKIRSYFQYT